MIAAVDLHERCFSLASGKAFDLCAVCGDFVPRPEGWSPDGETEEQLSAEEGEMSSTLGKLHTALAFAKMLSLVFVHRGYRAGLGAYSYALHAFALRPLTTGPSEHC